MWDLPEFLHDVLKVDEFRWAEFPPTPTTVSAGLNLHCHAVGVLGESAVALTLAEGPS